MKDLSIKDINDFYGKNEKEQVLSSNNINNENSNFLNNLFAGVGTAGFLGGVSSSIAGLILNGHINVPVVVGFGLLTTSAILASAIKSGIESSSESEINK